MKFDLEWLYDIYILEIWHIFSIILAAAFLCYICLNARRSSLLNHYILVQGILLNWLIWKVFKTIAPTEELKWIFIVAQYAGVCFLGSSLLMFGFIYARGKPMALWLRVLINIPPLFFFLVILTNGRHNLFYRSYDFLGDTFGPLFYAYSVMTYFYLLLGIFFCASKFRRNLYPKNLQARLLIIGIIIPLIVNALYISGLMEPRFDLTPVSCNISLLLFAYAIYRYQFLDVVPIGISEAFNSMQEGVLVFDDQGRIIDRNRTINRFFDLEDHREYETIEEIEHNINSLPGGKRAVFELAEILKDSGQGEGYRELIIPGERERFLSMRAQPNQSDFRDRWYMCIIFDNTVYRELIKAMEESNRQLVEANEQLEAYARDLKRLAIVEERNRMARDIHDILGHSLVLVLNILESSLVHFSRDPAGVRVRIGQALSSAREAREQLRKTFREPQDGDIKTTEHLEGELQQLTDKYRQAGIIIELTVKGPRKTLPGEYYRTIFRVCQEAMTNSLKHGRADEINIVIRMNMREMEIFIVDNGQGCSTYQKGHGINGLEQRVGLLKGVLSCGSPGDSGFMVHARLPC